MNNIVEKTKERLVEYEKRHQAILNAAMRLFNAKGYAATTTASIAKEAGVTEKTMYRHFKNKEVLFGACVLAITEDIDRLWKNARERTEGDDLGYLKAMARSFVEFLIHNPHKSMFLVHLYSYRVVPELDEGFKAAVEQRLRETEKVIQALQEKGTIKSSMHPRVLAGLFVGQYFTMVFMNEFLGPDLFNPDTAMELMVKTMEVDE
jgi:AcrR family transcriptional regulator